MHPGLTLLDRLIDSDIAYTFLVFENGHEIWAEDEQVQRINAAARLNGSTYGQFINGLTKAGIEIDRKVLAELAISDAVSFQKLVEKAQASLK